MEGITTHFVKSFLKIFLRIFIEIELTKVSNNIDPWHGGSVTSSKHSFLVPVCWCLRTKQIVRRIFRYHTFIIDSVTNCFFFTITVAFAGHPIAHSNKIVSATSKVRMMSPRRTSIPRSCLFVSGFPRFRGFHWVMSVFITKVTVERFLQIINSIKVVVNSLLFYFPCGALSWTCSSPFVATSVWRWRSKR